MRYQKEFEYVYETIEKLHVTITNQSEALSILAENDLGKDNGKDLILLGSKVSHLWNLSKHHNQNTAFQLELETQLNDVLLKLYQESFIEVECSLLLQQVEILVPLLKTKQSINLMIEEKFSELRDEIGSIISTNGCYDINHLTPYLEKGYLGHRISLTNVLDWFYPDKFMLANKCSTNCSNNKLVSPSPTPAEPRNIIGTTTKVDLFEEKKVPNSKLSESKKIRKYGKADLYGEKKVPNSKLSKSTKIGKYSKIRKPQPLGTNKSKSTFGFPSKRKQNSKSGKANNKLPEILTALDSNENSNFLPFQLRLLLKRPRVKIK